MASSQSLLGLVNQLQSMEMTFTTILMESAMKLSALTDANIFVLVESQEGRKYCGKKHLCDAYAGTGLSTIGNDVEMEVNPSITALREKRFGHQPPLRSQQSPSSRMKQGSPNSSSTENLPTPVRIRRKRPSGTFSSALPAKQARHQQPFAQLQQGQQQQPQQAPQLSQQHQTVRPSSDFDKDDHVVVVDVKQELSPDLDVDPNGNTLLGSLVDAEGGRGGGGDGNRKCPDSDDSDFAEIVEEVQSRGEELPLNSIEKALNRVTNSIVNHQNAQELLNSSAPGYEDLSDVLWQPSTGSPYLQNDSGADLSASEQDKVYERFLGRIADDGRRKIEAIQSFGEDKILFVKGSAPQKILSSLCYSLGKAVTEECIEYGQVDPKSHFPKQLFVILIDRFLLDHFPQLIHAYAKLRHEIKKTFFSVLNKVKNKAVYSPPVAFR